MLQDNPLLAQLKQQLHKQTPRVEGIIRIHEKGYGFLDTENKKSYFVPASKTKNVIHGDKISGIIVANNDKESFEPESLVESALDVFLGKIDFENKAMVITPEKMNGKVTIRCKVHSDVQTRLKAGDWVKAKLISHPLEEGKNSFFAEVTQFVAEADSPYLLWLMTLARYNLETTAPHAKDLALPDNTDLGRIDLTQLDFFTIDSQETQDMDDALFIGKDEHGHFSLSVAIADPSTYVQADSELDNIAKVRHFSTYLPNFTVPMLPKSLANELCSLKAGEKRPALVCQITIDQQGNILEPIIFNNAWIISKAKLAYNQVSDYLESNVDGDLDTNILQSDVLSLPEQLELLSALTRLRLDWRKNNALLFKDNPDYRFVFDENRKIIAIKQEPRRFAHKMVEESMVIANQAFTQKLIEQVGFGIFNCHSGFDVKYIDTVLKILQENGIENMDKETLLSFDGYKNVRRLIQDNDFLEYRLRRYQTPADFSIEPKAHFGMGFEAYATWTSPIRKYGDMINHRLIKAVLNEKSNNRPDDAILQGMNERRKILRFAERDISEKLYAQYLSDKIGETYQAQLIDINRGGAKVRLVDIGAVAFMPLSLIHANRQEITPLPEDGVIKIKEEITFKLMDTIDVVINDVKSDNQSVIVKLFQTS